jgi:hypothetical protein
VQIPVVVDTDQAEASQLLVGQNMGKSHACPAVTGWLLLQPGGHHMADHARVRCWL